MAKKRCTWCNEKSTIYRTYHDEEWGVPVHDDQKLFEMLILEGAQAGLAWETILKKRNNYRKSFNNFNPNKVASYNEKKISELLQNKGIIRNRLKIVTAIQNARIFLNIQTEFGCFDKYFWNYVDNVPIKNNFQHLSDIPTKTNLSIKVSNDLKKRGMNFVGPTIIYALMQSVGMVNDHEVSCYKYCI